MNCGRNLKYSEEELAVAISQHLGALSDSKYIAVYYRFWVQDIVHQSTPLLEYFAGRVQGSYVTVSMHDALPDSLIGYGSISLKIWKQNQYILFGFVKLARRRHKHVGAPDNRINSLWIENVLTPQGKDMILELGPMVTVPP